MSEVISTKFAYKLLHATLHGTCAQRRKPTGLLVIVRVFELSHSAYH